MIKVLEELKSLIPPLTQEEFENLRNNILQDGVIRDPLCVFIDVQGYEVLIDGHNRYKIAQETGIHFDTKILDNIRNIEDAKIWMLTNQLGKRNLDAIQKLQIARQYKPLFEKIGREKQRNNNNTETLVKADKPHETRVEMAKIAGVGKETVRKFEKVMENGDDATREKMLANTVSVNEAYKETLRREGSMRRLTLRRESADIEARVEALPAQESLACPAPEVQVGQWWRLGNHFLYVGDSSLPEFYKSEFCQMKNGFDFCFADPPYGIDAGDWDSEFVWNHDYLSDLAKVVAVTPGHWAMNKFHKITNMPYKWTMAYWVKNGMSRGAVGLANFNSIVLFSKGSVHRQEQDFLVTEENQVIPTTVKTTQDAYETPFKGRKPMEVVMRLLDMFVKPNGTVIDPFGGSGTTLFAAEAQGKTCIMAEILPAHALQIIRRFESLTTWKAKLIK